MKNKKDPQLDRDEGFAAENEVLKMKLKLEYGMDGVESGDLPAEVENQWLKSIYAFEQRYKQAKRTTVYHFIGQPPFRRWDVLTDSETREELQRLKDIMSQHSVKLDCLAGYDDTTIYRFLTEELFPHEMDDLRIPGMVTHFIYEEFHPNHALDLRRHAEHFLRCLLTRPWNPQFDEIGLAHRVRYAGKSYETSVISSIVMAFQEARGLFDLQAIDITQVDFNESNYTGQVQAHILAWSQSRTNVHLEGQCDLSFIYSDKFWEVSEFAVPGFGDRHMG